MERMCALIMLVLLVAIGRSQSQYYSLDPAQAYEWTKSYPQSCECAETTASQSSCSLFKCGCTCDVTAGKCDYNCCCDPDCSSDQTSRFALLGVCAFQGAEPDTVEYCYNSAELYGVNPKSPMGGQPTARQAVGKALCVEKKNYAFKHEFFTSADIQSSQVFSQDAGQKAYSYPDSSTVAQGTLVPDAFYDQNDTLAALQMDHALGQLVSSGRGFLTVPRADADGACNENSYASFENSLPLTACSRTMASSEELFAKQCTEHFSVSRYVSDLYVAINADTLASSGAVAAGDVLRVTMGSVRHADWVSGALTTITDLWAAAPCQTIAFPNASLSVADMPSSSCFFADSTSSAVLLAADAVCMNMVKQVHYTILHSADAAAAIVNITADVVLTDVPYSADGVRLAQAYGLTYTSVLTGGASKDNGNLVKRQRSGNPGYIMGMPVLFGFASPSSASVVDELVDGLALPATFPANSLTCPASTDRGALVASFGYDTVTGCSLTLTRQQLKDFCCAGASGTCLDNADSTLLFPSPYAQSNGLPYFLNFTAGYVGIYGDADPLDVTQWLAMDYSAPADHRAWNDRTSTCTGVFGGLNIQLLVASSGERTNPQNKIVSALAEIVTSDWSFQAPKNDNISTQSFQLNAIASYVFQDASSLEGYEPPAPPVLFKMPYDVFYPFLVSSGSSRIGLQTVISALLLVVLSSSVLVIS